MIFSEKNVFCRNSVNNQKRRIELFSRHKFQQILGHFMLCIILDNNIKHSISNILKRSPNRPYSQAQGFGDLSCFPLCLLFLHSILPPFHSILKHTRKLEVDDFIYSIFALYITLCYPQARTIRCWREMLSLTYIMRGLPAVDIFFARLNITSVLCHINSHNIFISFVFSPMPLIRSMLPDNLHFIHGTTVATFCKI